MKILSFFCLFFLFSYSLEGDERVYDSIHTHPSYPVNQQENAAQINTEDIYDEEDSIIFSNWGSYTYFYLDDSRAGIDSKTHGQNVIYAGNYYLTPNLLFGLYGTYERTITVNPITPTNNGLIDVVQQTFGYAEGWGIGGRLSQYFQKKFWGVSLFFDYSYVWARSSLETLNLLTNIAVEHASDGSRWQISTGFNAMRPIGKFLFNGNVNYQYISSRNAGSVDAANQQLTGQNSQIGIGFVNGVLYLMPMKKINPFISGGIAVDIHRSNQFPRFIGEFTSNVASSPLRKRFEWNVGTGIVMIKNAFSFAVSYLHNERGGPIIINSINFYGSMSF